MKNPERTYLSRLRARAKRAGVPCHLTSEWVRQTRWWRPCPICGDPAGSLDRIIPALGYVEQNVQWLCGPCNTQKNNATPEKMRQIAEHTERVLMERGLG